MSRKLEVLVLVLALGALGCSGASNADDAAGLYGADAGVDVEDAARDHAGPSSDGVQDQGADSAPIDRGPDAFLSGLDLSALGDLWNSSAGPDGGTALIHVDDLNDGQQGSGSADDPFRDLQLAIDEAPDGAVLMIHAGTYEAEPVAYKDPGCGNCSAVDYADGAEATRGFYVTGKSLVLLGEGTKQTTLVTNAGYGLLFEDAGTSVVRDLRVTGGKRDADGRATDAGIVVRRTRLLVQGAEVSENDDLYEGEPDPVVGVGGIFGREGAELVIVDSVIQNNSWDGVALYRGEPGKPATAPRAVVRNCRIGCTASCVTKRGRGVGIGVTWDAQLIAVGNTIFRYWKGIGSFGTTRVMVHNNLVRDQYGWGIVASGNSTMIATNNVVLRSGTTGMAAWSSTTKGAFVNNIVAGSGTAKTEWVGKKTGVWFNAKSGNFILAYNAIHDNGAFDVCTGGTPEEKPCQALDFDGLNGNMNVDPGFVSSTDLHLAAGSPAIDGGDPGIADPDGSRSDIGLHGGPDGDFAAAY